jgi:hypothetical protein
VFFEGSGKHFDEENSLTSEKGQQTEIVNGKNSIYTDRKKYSEAIKTSLNLPNDYPKFNM